MIEYSKFTNNILPITTKWEGGYVNDPRDAGGETYRGISRKYNPNWNMWPIIDRRKPIAYNTIFKDMESSVSDFYYTNYFKRFGFHQLNSERLAIALFDFAVLGGYSGGLLVRVVNEQFNKKLNASLGLSVTAAGIINNLNDRNLSKLIVAVLWERKKYLDQKALQNPEYAKGWSKRLADITASVGVTLKKPLPIAMLLGGFLLLLLIIWHYKTRGVIAL